MTIRILNWCSAAQLECEGTIPTTVYLCVPTSIVVTETGFVEGTVTAVRNSTCSDSCGPCKKVYTISYDDVQLVEGKVLTVHDIAHIFCANNCLIDFIIGQASCEKVRTCISVEDSDSLDLSYDPGTGVIGGEVIVSPLAGNAINDTPEGLYATPGMISCDDTSSCISLRYCSYRVTNETELLNVEALGATALIAAEITLTNDLTLTIPVHMLACGFINTDGNILTFEGPFSVSNEEPVFNADPGEVLFSRNSVAEVRGEWFGAANDGVTDSVNALNTALASTDGVLKLLNGVYLVSGGLTLTRPSWIQGGGWQTIIRNSSATEHTISYTGPISAASAGVQISNLAIEHTGGGSVVNGINVVNLSSFVRLEHLYVLGAPNTGIYFEADAVSHTAALYSKIDQVKSEGAGNDGVYVNGSVNALTIVGGRFGGNGRNGLRLDDTITGTSSFPNTVRVFNTDLPGNDVGLYENGHSNAFFGIRFEGNTTNDIEYGPKSQSAMFFGTAYSSGPSVTGTPLARPQMYDKDYRIRQFESFGFFEWWDENDGAVRKGPKRSLYNMPVEGVSAATTIANRAIARVSDRVKVRYVSIIPDAAITGANVNNMQLQVRNKKAGGGDVAVATLTFSLGINVTLLEHFAIPLSVGNENLADGDVLYFVKNVNGGGMALPNIMVQIEYGGY